MLVIRSLFKTFICFYPDGAAGGGASGTGDPAPAGSGAPGTATQPDLQAAQALVTEWQNRATGWQQKFQLEQDAHLKTTTALKELQEANGKVVTEHTTTLAERDALKKKETTHFPREYIKQVGPNRVQNESCQIQLEAEIFQQMH